MAAIVYGPLHTGLLSARTVGMMHCKCAEVRLSHLSSCSRRRWFSLGGSARVADVIYRWADISHSMTSAAAAVSTPRCSELKRDSCWHVTSAVHAAARRRVNLNRKCGNRCTASLANASAKITQQTCMFTQVPMQQMLKRCYEDNLFCAMDMDTLLLFFIPSVSMIPRDFGKN